MNNEKKNTWIYNRNTDTYWVVVPSLVNTPVSQSTGCNLYDCPGCSNIWELSPYRRTSEVISRTTPVREGGQVVGHVISSARLADACWCGVPFPGVIDKMVSEIKARANVKAALRVALSREGEEPSVVEEIQTLRGKVTSKMMQLLRGERSSKAQGVA